MYAKKNNVYHLIQTTRIAIRRVSELLCCALEAISHLQEQLFPAHSLLFYWAHTLEDLTRFLHKWASSNLYEFFHILVGHGSTHWSLAKRGFFFQHIAQYVLSYGVNSLEERSRSFRILLVKLSNNLFWCWIALLFELEKL